MTFGIRKLESTGIVCVITGIAVLIELRFVADRQTDRWMDGKTRWQHVPR